MNHTFTPPHSREKKLGRYLGLSYILAGACFLFDPFVSVVDALPDCLGYLFFSLGLYRLADLDDRLAEAAKGARRLALLGVGRILAFLLAFGFVSATEQPVFILLAVFSLGVLDCVVLVPMWKNLSGGLLYLGSRHDATVLFDRRRRNGGEHKRSMTERYVSFSIGYFVTREVLAVLPEITVLSHESGGAEVGYGTHYYDFVGLLREVCGFVALILGIIWLVRTVLFIHRLKMDEPFFAALREKYRTEVLTRHDLFAMRAVKASMTCLIVAAVFSIDFYLDSVNILPDLLAAVMLALAICFIRRYVGSPLAVVVSAVAYGGMTALTWGLQLVGYFRIDDTTEALSDEGLYDRWQVMNLCQLVTAILFVVTVLLVLYDLYKLVRRYTGVKALGDNAVYAQERTESVHRRLGGKLILVAVFAAVTALSTLFHWIGIPYLADLPVRSDDPAIVQLLIEFFVEAYWFIDICFGAILVGVTIHATGEITDRMEYSYMMND